MKQNKTISNIEIRMLHILFLSVTLMSISLPSGAVFSVRMCIWTVRVRMMTPDTRHRHLHDKTILLSAINNYYTYCWETWVHLYNTKINIGWSHIWDKYQLFKPWWLVGYNYNVFVSLLPLHSLRNV